MTLWSCLSNEILRRKISLYKKYDYIPALQVDPNQLKQALLNLLINAIEAMPEGGDLKVATHNFNFDNEVEILIQDSGPGITKEELLHAFDPFYSTKDSGTGLGLSITHEIIKKHNATIDIDSVPGMGVTVIIRFKDVLDQEK